MHRTSAAWLRTVDEFAHYCARRAITNRSSHVDDFINTDPEFIKWSSSLKQHLARGVHAAYDDRKITVGSYRPFDREHVYFDRIINHRRGSLGTIFPTPDHNNIGILTLTPRDGTEFATLATNLIPDLSYFTYTVQFFPRWTYEKANSDDGGFDFGSATGDVDEHGYHRVDNITDAIVELYEQAIGAPVAKDDVFYYVYGLLHDPDYRRTYAADLRKMLPHIPTPTSRPRFEQLAAAGRALVDLHVNYESVAPYPLDVQLKPGADPDDRETWRVTKMKWMAKGDHTAIVYNPQVTISGIPEEAERYQLGSRSALGWIIDRYQRKVDRASGIINDPNGWCDEHDDPRYIVSLIQRVTTVAVETMKIVDQLAE